MTDKKHIRDKHSRNLFGLTVLKNSHPDARRLRRQAGEPSLHGNKLWKSTTVLMDYLQESPPPKQSRILEIGCGWGLSGIFCAKTFDADVTSLDADENVLPFTEYHAKANNVTTNTIAMRFEDISAEQLEQFDVIIGADICFWDELTDTLYQLINRAIEAGVPRIILTDPGRPPFRDLAGAAETLATEEPKLNLDVRYTDWDVPNPHNAWGLVLEISLKGEA